MEDNKFTQSQSHGLVWDSEIREKVFKLPQCINDTKKYDIDCIDNMYCPNENVSIKTTCSANIDCGDIQRFYNNDFTENKYTNMIVIVYEQRADTKQIKEIIEFKYNEEIRNFLFGTITKEEIEEYNTYIKSIPKGPVPQEIKINYKKTKQELQDRHNMFINISPKVDSKSQRRVQCSIPKMQELFARFPSHIISRTDKALVKNVAITSIIPSTKRIRNKKIAIPLLMVGAITGAIATATTD
jgi:hypothetical protein